MDLHNPLTDVSPMNRFCLLLFGLVLVVGSVNPSGTMVFGQQLAALQTPSSLNRSPLAATENVAEQVDDQGRNRPAGSGSSLGKLLRDRADELDEDEPTESLGGELADETGMDEDAENEHDEEEEEKDQQYSRDRSTDEHLLRLRKPMSEIRIGETEPGERVPDNKAATYSQQKPLIMIAALGAEPLPPNRYTVCFMHRPLYYEQPNLERCGSGYGYCQNTISGIQFLVNTMKLPYQLGAERADCPVPTRGDCMTCQSLPVELNPFPFDWHGLLTESAATAGFTFLLL